MCPLPPSFFCISDGLTLPPSFRHAAAVLQVPAVQHVSTILKTTIFLIPIFSHSLHFRIAMETTTTTKGAGGIKGGKGKKAVSKSSKVGLQFPIGRIARFMKKGHYSQRIGTGAPIYLAEVLELAGNVARDNKKNIINPPRHVCLAARNVDELGKLLQGVAIASGGVLPNINPVFLPKKNGSAATEKSTKSPKK
ncbi:putative transcription factor Hap3/NF-YB family [Medicago truncatula]|uniref:Histone H2A n=1 Tax=Medicago truncatula TaxID=3880 RepID=A0A396IX40_MEDTR|nr:histone H2A.1-like [Medicago truncatula]RHN68993.1 putative transcription factor Hap3/NF-YB family [Medicago truncatula]